MTANEYDVIAALVAREEQRERDRAVEHELRVTLREQDDRWRTETVRRIDRVQVSVEAVARDLAASLNTRVSDAQALRQQSDEIVARMQKEAEAVALRLHAETEGVAEKLGDVTLQTAEILKGRQERKVLGNFLSRGMRIFIALVAVVLFASLAYALFEHRDDISGDVATGIAAMAAVAAIIYGFNRK